MKHGSEGTGERCYVKHYADQVCVREGGGGREKERERERKREEEEDACVRLVGQL